jgi:hypothetical protein
MDRKCESDGEFGFGIRVRGDLGLAHGPLSAGEAFPPAAIAGRGVPGASKHEDTARHARGQTLGGGSGERTAGWRSDGA